MRDGGPVFDRLEAAGLVVRAWAVDRRVVIVSPTEAGQLLEEKVVHAGRAVVCRTGLAQRDLAELREELKDLADRIGAIPRDRHS